MTVFNSYSTYFGRGWMLFVWAGQGINSSKTFDILWRYCVRYDTTKLQWLVNNNDTVQCRKIPSRCPASIKPEQRCSKFHDSRPSHYYISLSKTIEIETRANPINVARRSRFDGIVLDADPQRYAARRVGFEYDILVIIAGRPCYLSAIKRVESCLNGFH